MSIATLNEMYYNRPIANVEPNLKFDMFANPDYTSMFSTGRGQTAVYTVVTSPDSDTTEVDPTTGAANVIEQTETTVEIALKLLHEGVIPVTMASPLYGTIDNGLLTAIDSQSKKIVKDLNALALEALLDEIPDNDSTDYTWGVQNSKTYSNVCTGGETVGGHGLVHNVNVASFTSRTAISAVTSSDVLADPKWLDFGYSVLADNGATPIMNWGGQDLYKLDLPANLWARLRESASVEGDIRYIQIEGQSAALLQKLPMYRGFIINVCPKQQLYRGAVGASSADVYSVIFSGAGYLANPAMPAASIPIVEPSVQNVIRIPASDRSDIRITPQGDAAGANVNVAAVFRLGYGILKPEEGFRMNFAG